MDLIKEILAKLIRFESITPDADEIEDAKEDDPASFILFMDSLKAHQIAVIAKRIRTWLNSEWKRLRKNIEFQKDDPFKFQTLIVHNPKSTWCRGSISNSWRR